MLGAGAGAVILYFLLHFWSPEQGWSQGRCWEMCVERMAESINQTQDFLTIIRLSEVHTPSAQKEKKKSLHLGFQILWRQIFTSFSLGNSLSTTAAIGFRSAPSQSRDLGGPSNPWNGLASDCHPNGRSWNSHHSISSQRFQCLLISPRDYSLPILPL